MSPVTGFMLRERQEADCFAITAERKYYDTGSVFIKRSLRPREWQVSHVRGTIHVPRQAKERIFNEAATIQYLSQHSSIPLPKFICCFEDDEAVYLIVEKVDGISMKDLTGAELQTVTEELQGHIRSFRRLRSSRIGGPSGLVVPPYRTTRQNFRDDWNLQEGMPDEYVFCHNDLSQHNVILDPESLKIKAIVDWEYAGFYPEFFDAPFYKRPGPSAAIGDEVDDTDRLVEFLRSRRAAE